MVDALRDPPSEFSLMPFWFWNDQLSEAEILRQIDDLEQHGVHGFVIHPRVGLPRDCGWMSDTLLGFMQVAIDEAARRGMKVILYDEGMYPSGSSCGQVVERWPELACRCLALHDVNQPLPAGANVVAEITDDAGQRRLVVDRVANSYIRGLHYNGEGPAEDEPPAADILNPRTADAIIELVYGRFAERFGNHFGKTVLGIFTDEPSPLGKCREKRVFAGTTGSLAHISRLLGYDFTPHLADLWSTRPEARRYQDDYRHAIRQRLDETWYKPLSDFCASRGIALCGHPDAGDEIGVQRFFHIPGQDLVWRWVAPGEPTALEGPESTQAKCTSSAMIHLGRRRNSNEFAGAYGAETTFDEIRWLANWCLVRGVNLLFPHAFYYSVRGPRRDERPPQIGLHTPQWESGEFHAFADACRRLCWINTDSRHLCDVAILTHADRCPWPAASVLLQRQRDFNYMDPHTLLNHAQVDADGLHIASMTYRLLILDGPAPLTEPLRQRLEPMVGCGRVVRWLSDGGAGIEPSPAVDVITDPAALVARIDAVASLSIGFTADAPASLRVRRVEKAGRIWTMLFNEDLSRPISAQHTSTRPLVMIDLATGKPAGELSAGEPLEIRGGAMAVLTQ